MILVICTDDRGLEQLAAEASVAAPREFGQWYRVFAERIPKLTPAENLFILAHGAARGDDGNPVIGDQRNAFYLNAVDLFRNLTPLFPQGWIGSVYVSACESYNPGVNSLSFAEMLCATMQAAHRTARVFGHQGGVAGALPLPNSNTWLQAASTHRDAILSRTIDTSSIVIRDATADPNGEMMKKIYSKLSETISVGGSIQAPGNSFLVLASPGIFVDPSLDLTKVDDEALWASVLNRIPLPNFIYSDSGQSLDALVDLILLGKELPLVELTPDQKKQLAAAEAVLMDGEGNPTPAFLRYFDYQEKYYDALTAYNDAKATAVNDGTPIPPRITAALKKASDQWGTLGGRAKIENAVATVNNLQELDPNNWWQQMRDQYKKNQETASSGDFAKTVTYPAYPTIFGDSGWSKYSFTQDDYKNQEVTKSVDAGGSLSAGWGLWRASAEASYNRDEGYKKSTASGISIEVELMRLQITRPWLNSFIFRSRAWRWSPASPLAEPISNGIDASTGATPTGVMPLFPTTLVLARNLVLSATFSEDEQKWMHEQIQAKASFGWGPFSVNGHYNQTKDEKYAEGHVTSTSVSNADPQILGWMCNVLPLCPNPDPSLPWPSKMTLEHLPEYGVEAAAHLIHARNLAIARALSLTF